MAFCGLAGGDGLGLVAAGGDVGGVGGAQLAGSSPCHDAALELGGEFGKAAR
jgi:hypothetical protein